jgi:NAD(P)-dependent dehydrogenase (short-subunit alcohol dehydrogenase family)
VTGAAQGVGRATARAAALLGAHLVVSDRCPLDELKASLPGHTVVDTVQGDMGEPGFAERLFEFGPVYGLAHCAAVFYPGAVGKAELLARIG